MDSKSVYQSIVEMLFNTLKHEKTRTKILFDVEFKTKIIGLVNNLLSLEVDHEATFKDKKWSTTFAKAIVNISKEKIKFEKPEDKSITDSYGDYAALLTYCLNQFEVDKEILTSTTQAVEEDKIKDFKITEQLKEQFGAMGAASTIEVVDEKIEKPNTSGFDKTNNNKGFSSFGQGASGFGQGQQPFTTPIPPMQDPRFYPYKSKPKYMKYLKIALGATFGILGVILIIISILDLSFTESIDIKSLVPDVLSLDGNTDISRLRDFSLSIFSFLGYQGSMSLGIIFIPIYGLMIGWITYNMIAAPKRYREQFVFPLINIIAPLMLIIFVLIGYMNSFVFKGMTNNLQYFDLIKSELQSFGYKIQDVNKLEAFFETGDGLNFIETLESKKILVSALLWIQFTFAIASVIFAIVVIILNPKLDREKVMYANNEFQTMINEALQGRKHEIDPSIYEDQAEIDAFYQKIKEKQERKQNRNKDNE